MAAKDYGAGVGKEYGRCRKGEDKALVVGEAAPAQADGRGTGSVQFYKLVLKSMAIAIAIGIVGQALRWVDENFGDANLRAWQYERTIALGGEATATIGHFEGESKDACGIGHAALDQAGGYRGPTRAELERSYRSES